MKHVTHNSTGIGARNPRLVAACLLAAAATVAGCRTPLDVSELETDQPTQAQTESTEIRGPLQRLLSRSPSRADEYSEYGDPLADSTAARTWLPFSSRDRNSERIDQELEAEAIQRLHAGRELYEAGEMDEAADTLHPLGYRRRYRHSSVREEALFLLGEAHFAEKRYAKAQDDYEWLLKDYPSSRHIDAITQRLFVIARNWLQFPEFATTGDIQPVSFTDGHRAPTRQEIETEKPADPTLRVPILPNFHDRSRPVFDTNGRALKALKSIWLNDPTGPLADDSLMLTASHYLRKGDYVEADRYFQILREEYPKSDHLQAAFVLGSHVKLMSYSGAAYDGRKLDEARELKENALRLFPDAADRERIRRELAEINEAAARRDWELVEFYSRKNNDRAMAVYCLQILEKHPTSRYAQNARETLAGMDPTVFTEFPDAEKYMNLVPPASGQALDGGAEREPARVRLEPIPGRAALESLDGPR